MLIFESFCLFTALEDFKNLVTEAKGNKYPTSNLLNDMNMIVQEADQLSFLSARLLEKKEKPKYVVTCFNINTALYINYIYSTYKCACISGFILIIYN